MFHIISYIALGLLCGVIFGISYAKFDKKWQANTVSFLIIPITWGVLTAASEYFGLSAAERNVPSACYLITFVFTFLTVFVGICYFIKTQKSEEDRVRIRVLDIVLGFTESLQGYYEDRCAEIRGGLSLDEYQKAKDEYLGAKEKAEYALKKLKEKETIITNLLTNGKLLSFEYPISSSYPVTDGFIKALPLYAMNYAAFQHNLIGMTRTYMAQYDKHQVELQKIEKEKKARRKAKGGKKSTCSEWDVCNEDAYKVWNGFFFGLCHLLNTVLFDTKKNMVRSHVRILVNGNYEKLVAVTGDSVYEAKLTPIPKAEGMIIASHKNHTSLVKSLNMSDSTKLHYKGNNDSKWEDYLTFTLTDFEEDGYPLISIGISIANSEQYRDLLYFVNYMRIEDLICKEINRLNKAYDLNYYIREWREKNGGL